MIVGFLLLSPDITLDSECRQAFAGAQLIDDLTAEPIMIKDAMDIGAHDLAGRPVVLHDAILTAGAGRDDIGEHIVRRLSGHRDENAPATAHQGLRLIVVTTQTQLSNTAGATGVDGAPLTSVQLNAAVNSVLLQQLQTLATAVLDNPALSDTSSSMKDKQSAMETAARQVASASGVTAGNVGLIAAMQSQASTPEAGGPTASTQLRWLSFTDTSNYYIRAFEATAEQNTPDANGKRYFTEFRERVVGGQEQPWTRPQVYWTGSEWFACPTDFVQQVTSLASGESESLYCKSLASRARQSVRNIAGLKMRDIVTEIRSAPWQDAADGSFSNWGPRPDQVPAETTFPSGSTLSYRTVTDLGGSAGDRSPGGGGLGAERADAEAERVAGTGREGGAGAVQVDGGHAQRAALGDGRAAAAIGAGPA